MLISPDGKPIRAWTGGVAVPVDRFQPIADAVHENLVKIGKQGSIFGKPHHFHALADTRWPFDAKDRPLTRYATSLIDHDHGAALLTVASILPDTDYTLLKRMPNYLVAVRHVDRSFLAEMGDAMLLRDLAFADKQPQMAGINSVSLAGSRGQRLGWLHWRSEPLSSVLARNVTPIFVAYVAILLAVIAGGWAIVRALFRTMRELRAREAHARHIALHDGMTGLPNRENLFKRLSVLLEARSEDPDDLVIVAYFDIDHFKFVNDTIGHHVGDALICEVARRCRRLLRPGDTIARMGGDEFVLMRRARRGSGEVRRLAGEIMAIFVEPFDVEQCHVVATASCGISLSPDDGGEAEDLLRHADIALYRAKQRGRGRWRLFMPDMAETMRQRHELEVDLRRAIASDELSVAYQPIVRAADGTIEGFEALLRWHHPENGNISPGVFVAVAEQCGLMSPLGDWLLARVFDERRKWPEHQVSINLSPLQVMAFGFLDHLRDLVQATGVDPRGITFEITEGILLDSSARVFEVLGGLKRMGFTIALDDFGTGYSSLAYLRSFHFDRIKIDRSFVQNIENDVDAQSILRAIATLGQSLRMKIVAEGVETPLQRQLVLAAGCDFIQGHLYWQAMPAAEVEALIAAETPRACVCAAG